MAIYDGVVTLAEDDIPVIVELNDGHVRLSASGTEIGDWPADECEISHVNETVFTISAEDETIWFVPNQPSRFAAAVNGDMTRPAAVALPPEPEAKPTTLPGPVGVEIREAPAAKPLTMGLFYGLCVLTAGLAVWSLISIVF